MKKIQLTQGKFALVDDDDFPFLSKITWYARLEGNGNFYAVTNVIISGRQATLGMHRMILGFPIAHTDHIDGNGLNNQRHNLRKATKAQNGQNARKAIPPKSSKYKGVCHTAFAWTAKIGRNGKSCHLGSFRTEADAARAYNKAALEHFGEFARLNSIPDQETTP